MSEFLKNILSYLINKNAHILINNMRLWCTRLFVVTSTTQLRTKLPGYQELRCPKSNEILFATAIRKHVQEQLKPSENIFLFKTWL